ncbi:hypothetical protein ACFW2E_18275, partial [Streptomyces sp. NPDC058964]
MSTNPFADYQLIYAVVLIALAAAGAGATWGLVRIWARLPFVSRNRRLLRPFRPARTGGGRRAPSGGAPGAARGGELG